MAELPDQHDRAIVYSPTMYRGFLCGSA